MNKFDAHKRSIAEVLGYIYKIPFYQRGFSWKKDQINQFWEDLMMVRNENHSEYFLGSVVLNEKNGFFEIIDGQQRITTITIFLCVVRDFLLSQGKKDSAMNIHNYYIAKRDIRGRDEFRLTLSEENKTLFQDFILTPISDKNRKNEEDLNSIPQQARKTSNVNLIDAYKHLKKCVKNFVDENNDEDCDELITLVEILLDKFLIISISVTSDTDAYIIFETLNDRGLDLSTADLLKNHLFSRAKQYEIQDIQDNWRTLTMTLNQINITTFLRHYWLAKHERVTDKKLYEKIKGYLDHADVTVKEFIEDLVASADIYVNIVNPSYEYWGNHDLVDGLENINHLNYKAAYSLILIAKSKQFNINNLVKLVDACGKFLFKYVTIGGNSPSDVENYFNTLTKIIRKNGQDSLDKIIKSIKNKQPTDKQFKEIFSSKVISTQKVQRYILERINEHLGTKETVSNNPKAVHVEHIMPRKLNAAWKNKLNDVDNLHEEYVNRIGNVTLLSNRLNQSASNKSFKEKKEKYYSASEFYITKKLMEYEEWNFNTIDERQKKLAEIAVEVWRI